MQKIFKRFLTFTLALAMCFGITATVHTAVTDYVVADAATTDSYYSGITATSGTKLLGQLHDLIVDTHKTYTSYDDCKDTSKVKQTDAGDANNTVREFYTQEDMSSTWGSGKTGTWNREHVWCQSLSNGLWGTSGAGSDMHHIRPAETDLNGKRSNNKYGVASGGTAAYQKNTSGGNVAIGGYISGDTFEPLNNVKGDVARIVMYVYTHYNNASNVGGTKESKMTHGNLNFTNIMSVSSESAAKQLLLEWNKLDPVDEIERARNEAVYQIQGNRNPFIDNSSYAEAIWGNGTVVDPGPGTDPAPTDTLKSISLNPTAVTLLTGQTYDLTVTPNPSSASASVTWTSSNSSVATVSNGKISAKAAGTATITATSTVNSSIKATATVTVKQSSSSGTGTETNSITITLSSFDLNDNYGFQSWEAGGINGTAYIFGGNSSYPATSMQFSPKQSSWYLASTTATSGSIKSVTIKTANKYDSNWKLLTSTTPYGEVAEAPANGNNQGSQTLPANGSTSWTVSGNDTYFALVFDYDTVNKYTGYLEEIVVEYGTGSSSGTSGELEELLINPSAFSLKAGESTKLNVASIPSDASAEVNWTSSNPSVAAVSADGTVTAVKEGTATITATSTVNSSIKATATVTVTDTPFVSGSENATAFHYAVAAINSDGTLTAWHNYITAAIAAYQDMSEADKVEVVDDIVTLKMEIKNYNDAVKAYNGAAYDVEKPALSGAGRFI